MRLRPGTLKEHLAWLLLLPLALPVTILTGLAYIAGRLSAR